ncbi:hypothetical protein SUGI_1052820 [Cryptomeria japonica]|uniref:uncharacterized protein LOC131859552 n=1 Tax=Cryptomeria japonica TaxID=3369 RepID=UPI002414BD07|nr:uncharacterized protein LOC131859552 [Cryptomeria japonica]GLJ49625.1 hypothetical protein SUGI_1052820 [Cryptomeria japonica]
MCISLLSNTQIPATLPAHIQVEKKMAQRLGRFRSYTSQPSKAYFSGPKQGNAYKALLLDAGGTLLQMVQPVEETYAIVGSKHGVKASPSEIKKGFKKAFAEPWPERLRYQGDGRPFWRHIVAQATGCASNDYFEELYKHFSQGDAWKLPVGAYEVLSHLRDAGVKLAVVSNFDTRLRPILEDMDVAKLFNAIIISSEVGFEKPAPQIFQVALDQLNVAASKTVHIGDDQQADKIGAGALGIDSWLWGKDVHTFKEILHRILGSDVN